MCLWKTLVSCRPSKMEPTAHGGCSASLWSLNGLQRRTPAPALRAGAVRGGHSSSIKLCWNDPLASGFWSDEEELTPGPDLLPIHRRVSMNPFLLTPLTKVGDSLTGFMECPQSLFPLEVIVVFCATSTSRRSNDVRRSYLVHLLTGQAMGTSPFPAHLFHVGMSTFHV